METNTPSPTTSKLETLALALVASSILGCCGLECKTTHTYEQATVLSKSQRLIRGCERTRTNIRLFDGRTISISEEQIISDYLLHGQHQLHYLPPLEVGKTYTITTAGVFNERLISTKRESELKKY